MIGEDDLPLDGTPQAHGVLGRVAALAHALVWFFFDWCYSRRWKDMAGGLPAILVGGAALIVLLIGRTTSPTALLGDYSASAKTALEQKDYAAAELYYRRTALLDDGAPATIYGMAQAAAGRGDLNRARSLMRRIAPDKAGPDDGGFPQAHFWLAKDMLGAGKPLSPAESFVVERHLLRSLSDSSQNIEAHALLGYLYNLRGDIKQAILHLEAAARARPELMAVLAVLYAKQKDDLVAKNAATNARNYFARRAESEPKVVEYRLQWGLMEALLQNYEQAAKVLQPGLESSDPKRFRDTLVGVYLAWYRAMPANNADELAKRMELLKRALDLAPDNPQVLAVLAGLSTGDSGNADEARSMLEKVLAQGKAPAILHAILGTRALQKGELAKARMHLELANQGDPQMPIVLNNLAWLLATQEKPDLEHALALAESAKKLSNDPELSATLGTILFRLGRYRQAVSELETATAAFPQRPRIHAELAECYEKLGDPELAKLHRKLADEHN